MNYSVIRSLKNDIHFQINYGFYFLYAFFSVVYIIVLMITPPEYKNMAASLIILTDPAMLGIFFMGGIWLPEKGEGLHGFFRISPLRPMEYILSKSVSLAILSFISADLIALIAMRSMARFLFLSFSVFTGAVVFNLIGLVVASYARSVNHYMIIAVIPTVFLSIPPLLRPPSLSAMHKTPVQKTSGNSSYKISGNSSDIYLKIISESSIIK